MTKYARVLAVIAVLVTVSLPSAFAATVVIPVTGETKVDGALTYTLKLFEGDIDGAALTFVNFKTLKDLGNGTLEAEKGVLAYSVANAHRSGKVTLKVTAGTLTDGANTIPVGACDASSVCVTGDQITGACNTFTAVGSGQWAAKTDLLIADGATGANQGRLIVHRYYMTIKNTAAGTVPIDQPGGTYTTTVTFTAAVA